MSGFDRFLEAAAHDFMRSKPKVEASAHLTREVLSNYRSRGLSGSEREHIQDHLVACRECADVLLGLIAQTPAPSWWKRVGSSFAGVARQPVPAFLCLAVIALGFWIAFLLSFRPLEFEPQSPAPAAELVAGPSRSQPGFVKESPLPILRGERTNPPDLQPQIQTPVVELFAGTSRGRPEAPKEIPLTPDMWIFTLVLHVPEPAAGAKFDLHLLNSEGFVLWRAKNVLPDTDGSITLSIPRQTTGEARQLRIRLLESGKRSIVAVYAIRLVSP